MAAAASFSIGAILQIHDARSGSSKNIAL